MENTRNLNWQEFGIDRQFRNVYNRDTESKKNIG